MNTTDPFRPTPPELDPAWSTATLERILSEPAAVPSRPRRTGRRLVAAAGVAMVCLGTGGVAVAGGLVPTFVTDAFDQLDGSDQTFDVSGVEPIADLRLPDGTRYAVWRGKNSAGGTCETVREDRPGDDHDDVRAWCNAGASLATYDRLAVSRVQLPEDEGAAPNPAWFVAYGESPDPSAVAVRITGGGAEVTAPVADGTGGFGAHLAGFVPAPDGRLVDLTFTFLDGSGAEVAVLRKRA